MGFPDRPPAVRRAGRDRHGRGMRGALAPPDVPISRSRSEHFDELVLDAVGHLGAEWQERLKDLEVAVEEVPDLPAAAADEVGPVPLVHTTPAAGGRPARLVVYRRPVEARASDPGDLADLVHDLVVEELADYLGVDPDELDPPA